MSHINVSENEKGIAVDIKIDLAIMRSSSYDAFYKAFHTIAWRKNSFSTITHFYLDSNCGLRIVLE